MQRRGEDPHAMQLRKEIARFRARLAELAASDER